MKKLPELISLEPYLKNVNAARHLLRQKLVNHVVGTSIKMPSNVVGTSIEMPSNVVGTSIEMPSNLV